MKELTKAVARRFHDIRYATRWFIGDAIDIGAGDDPLSNHRFFFPLLRDVTNTDKEDGDAMLMDWIADESFDTVHSSNCLEHCEDPFITMSNWIRICRRGGHVIITVPDEDLYEQGVFPTTWGAEHHWTFTIGKQKSWSEKSISLINFLGQFTDRVRIMKLELLDTGYIYGAPRFDQTLGMLAESAIEIVLQKL